MGLIEVYLWHIIDVYTQYQNFPEVNPNLAGYSCIVLDGVVDIESDIVQIRNVELIAYDLLADQKSSYDR